jgi:hypothetical protein
MAPVKLDDETLTRWTRLKPLGYGDDGGVDERMRASQAVSVSVLSAREDKLVASGRPVSVTEAFEIGPILAAAGESPAPPAPPPSSPLAAAMDRLHHNYSTGNALDLASGAAREILKALDEDRLEEAVDAIANIVRLESELSEGSQRLSLGIAMRPLRC